MKPPSRRQNQGLRIADLDLDDLVMALRSSIGSAWTVRDDAIRSAARHLGFRRTGRAIREAFKSAINAAIRRGLIERQGPKMIRKVRTVARKKRD
jgi:hypothetical protein